MPSKAQISPASDDSARFGSTSPASDDRAGPNSTSPVSDDSARFGSISPASDDRAGRDSTSHGATEDIAIASTEPPQKISSRPDTTPAKFRRLDALARIITGSDICASCIFYESQFIFSNNTNDYEFMKKQLGILSQIVEAAHDSREQKRNDIAQLTMALLSNALQELVYSFARSDYKKYQPIIQEAFDLDQIDDHNFRRYAQVYIKKLHGEKETFKSMSTAELFRKASSIIATQIERATTVPMWAQVFFGIHALLEGAKSNHSMNKKDITNIIDRIEKENIEQIKGNSYVAKMRKTFAKDCCKIVHALCDTKHKLFSGDMVNAIRNSQYLFLNEFHSGERGIPHAEMQILDFLDAKAKRDEALQDEIYIGIAKRCCAKCHYVIKYVNEHVSYMKVTVRGAHGKQYDSAWRKPDFLKEYAGYDDYERNEAVHSALVKSQQDVASDSESEVDESNHSVRAVKARVQEFIGQYDQLTSRPAQPQRAESYADRVLHERDSDDHSRGRTWYIMNTLCPAVLERFAYSKNRL